MAKKAVTKMNVEIKGTSYPLYIGFGFLDEIKSLETDDFDGLSMALLGLMDEDPFTVRAVLKASLNTHDAISESDIDHYVEQEMDIEKFCKDFLALLGSANLTKATVKRMLPILEDLRKAMMEQIKQAPKLIKEEMAKVLGSTD